MSINGISQSNRLADYLNSTSNDNLDSKKIFNKLSIDVGNDGKTITKDQLDSYIKNAEEAKSAYKAKETDTDESGISDTELSGLKTLQKNWDDISEGGDKITYFNVSASGFKSTLTGMDEEDTSKVDVKSLKEDYQQSIQDINSYLMESALGTSSNSSGAKSLLNTLLTGTTDENDDDNANLISKLVNIIEDYKSTSTIETEA